MATDSTTSSGPVLADHSNRNGSPRVTVMLPVFNGEVYVAEAVESILCQTYEDFELIVIDDGSTDATYKIVKLFSDPRIKLFRQPNLGVATALNRAISLARGELLARQDADDVSLPQRLEKQVRFLDHNPDCSIVGTWSEIWEEKQCTGRNHRHPCDDATLRFCTMFNTHFVHSSVMFRRDVVDAIGGYAIDPDRQPQDFELWSRVVRSGKFGLANIPEVLVWYREVPQSISRNREQAFARIMKNLCAENLAWGSGAALSDPVVQDAAALIHDHGQALSPGTNLRVLHEVLLGLAFRIGGKGALKNNSLLEELLRSLDTVTRNFLIAKHGLLLGKVLFFLRKYLLRGYLWIYGR